MTMTLANGTAAAPGSADFMQNVWRRRPELYRGFVDPATCAQLDSRRFAAWCRPPAVARLYVRTEDTAQGSARAYMLPDIAEAMALYEHFRDRGERLTVLLNHADAVDRALRQLRARFHI